MFGPGRVFKRGRLWWIAYHFRGKEIRESARSLHREDAKALLIRRVTDVRERRFYPDEKDLSFEDLVEGYLDDYALRELKSPRQARARVKHLRESFGGLKVSEIDPSRIRAHQAKRKAEGAAGATINRETEALGRMFRIARETGRLGVAPLFPRKLPEALPRQGFFEHTQYLAVRCELEPDLQDVLDFAYYSGWRRNEIIRLTWAEVDCAGEVIRLDPNRVKTSEPRVLPIRGVLVDVLARRQRVRRLDTSLVFHSKGKSVYWRLFRRWNDACKSAGVTGRLFHDCRRTVVRNLVRAGVPDRVAMSITGHRSRSVFNRYNITSEADLAEAMDRLSEYTGARLLQRYQGTK